MTKRKSSMFAKRSARRILVATTFLCCPGLLLLNLEQSLPQALLGLVLLVVSLITMGLLLMPNLIGTSDGSDDMLDERQLQVRNQAYLQAYRILALGVLLCSMYGYFSAQYGWWLPVFGINTVWVIIVIVVSLPPAVMAWLEPDPIFE